MEMQTIMASTVHDVKNSLGLINDQLNELVGKLSGTDDKSAQEIRRIQLECGRINNGMVHMLGLYKLHKGTFNPSMDEVFVPDVIQDVVLRYSELLQSMGIELEVHYEDEDLVWLMDANLIEGVLGNILTNSIRYTQSRLTIMVRERDGWLNIRIEDDGEGFPDAMITLLDQPDSVCFQSGATGLGLYFCQQIAKMHQDGDRKGYLQLSNSSEHSGAIVDLMLP
ncbi:sensor histidine kinase [Reinekea blandensis]|uniref:histidine kinase n=1 Tax=Reinekea blandensis MED297 TaxID=314283 RepID=A4BBX2_9GAMM|nr:HAMP domain-containing sensor histidine kinase [Reinekea blandensis]EAR10457.1 Signal transduction histidine kinase [Reinekea sp. MED297] [Reinekea blandensis MED297]